jgi:hypothetical protein
MWGRFGEILAGLMLLAATRAVGTVQPCPPGGNCAALSIAAPAAPVAAGDTVGVTLRIQQGHDNQQPGGIDNIAAVPVSIGISPLQLADCSPAGTDGLNPSFFLLPAASASVRVVVQNLTCAKRASCLCPMAGEPRDPYINLLLVGNANAGGVQPLPNGDLLVIALRVPGDAGALPAAAPLHLFSALDDPTQFPRPAGATWLSIADTRAVDQTVTADGTTMNIRVVDGSVALAMSTPTDSHTPQPMATATSAATAITAAATASPTSEPSQSASVTATPLAKSPTITPTPVVSVAPTRSGTRTIGLTATSGSATATTSPIASVTATTIAVTPTTTASPIVSAAATNTRTATITVTPTTSAIATVTVDAPPSASATSSAAATETAPPVLTVTPTVSVRPCVGDCDHSGDVTIGELIIGVNIVLGTVPASACPAVACLSGNGVDVSCLITAVNAALYGCPS